MRLKLIIIIMLMGNVPGKMDSSFEVLGIEVMALYMLSGHYITELMTDIVYDTKEKEIVIGLKRWFHE